jgi:hypothetical protein
MCRKLHILEFGCQSTKPPFTGRLVNLFVFYRTKREFSRPGGFTLEEIKHRTAAGVHQT